MQTNRNSEFTPARAYDKGMGEAVANRTINRKKPDGTVENWGEVAHRVALGNALLDPRLGYSEKEYHDMNHHLRQASLLMSGRHLQHGDADQPKRNMEVFTNCSTSATTFLSFYLLLNGSGVGRSYDDAMMQVNWNLMPIVVPVIDSFHGDVTTGEITPWSKRDAEHMYAGKKIHVYKVPDSREGWASAYEKVETMAFAGCYREDVLILDFSDVRPKGSPIKGMQNRPSSGPGPMMEALRKMSKLRNAGMDPWRATMFADHYAAECVLVGGARRAARMATKNWKDKTVLSFIELKRGGFLWSSNNSVMVDNEFWDAVKYVATRMQAQYYQLSDKTMFDELVGKNYFTDTQIWAWQVFTASCYASYHDGTGEPGFITVERLTWNPEGSDVLLDGDFAESEKMKLSAEGKLLNRTLANAWRNMQFKVITNPCGEIVLNLLGGYCVIADVVPFFAAYDVVGRREYDVWDADAEDAFRVATRALIRTNLMDSMYNKEVKRTNRIGVGITGLHEYAWARFGYGWKDLVDETKSIDFWNMLSRFKRAVQQEAYKYSAELNVTIPHTDTTMKPAGTTSKLFGLSEGAHLPSMREFVRWVQFRNDDPLIEVYREKNYPIKKLQSYSGTTVVGFPTVPTICTLGMGDKLVTAAEATPDEQYAYLRLLEKYWITGVDGRGDSLVESGNQVSYTLKYDPKTVTYRQFMETLLEGQSSIRCCSVMPQSDSSAYEYQPEEPVTKEVYEQISQAIRHDIEVQEDVGIEHVDCSTGACPISFGDNVSKA